MDPKLLHNKKISSIIIIISGIRLLSPINTSYVSVTITCFFYKGYNFAKSLYK